jgi:sugar lactone lactonase YvrE|nr:hypothetical protein [Kofleriaceae bacterium]
MRLWLVLALACACGNDGVHHLGDGGGDGGTPGSDGGSGGSGGSNLSSPGIYVTNATTNSVLVFDIDATGDVAPVRTIAGSNTGMALPIGLAVDALNNLYVANRTGSAVTVYASDATGDVAPIRTLAADGMGSPEGVAVTADGSVVATTCPNCGASAGGDTGAFHFPPGASTSDEQIVGNANITEPDAVAIDGAGEIVVGNAFGGTVATFAAGATGSDEPVRSFTPAGANLQDMTVGSASIFVTTPGGDLEEFPLGDDGSATAVTLGSADLSIVFPGGVAIDRTTSPALIYVVDTNGNAIYVLTTSGSEPDLAIASVRTITGSNTGLSQPLHVAVVH